MDPTRARWLRNGAIFGMAVALLDATGWRGEIYSPWLGEGIAYNLGSAVGYVFGGMLLFLLALSIRDLFVKK